MNQIEYIKNRINEYEGILDSIQKLGFTDDLKEKELSVKKEIENLKYELAGLNEIELIKENIRKMNLNINHVTNNKIDNNKTILNSLNTNLSNLVNSKGSEIRTDINYLNSILENELREIGKKIENSKHETKSLLTINKNKNLEDKLDGLERKLNAIMSFLKENKRAVKDTDNNKNYSDDKIGILFNDIKSLKKSFETIGGRINKLSKKIDKITGGNNE